MVRLTDSQRALVEDNLNLVRFVLKMLGVRRCDRRYDDLFSDGCVALCTAAFYYRPDESAFTTYAVHIIRHELLKIIKKDRRHALRTVSLENCSAELAVRECGYEAVEEALLVKAFFRFAGLSPPVGDPTETETISKDMRKTFAAFIREGK